MQGVKQTKATNHDTLIIPTHFVGIIIYIKSHRLVFVRFLIIKVPKRSESLVFCVRSYYYYYISLHPRSYLWQTTDI